MNKTESVMKWAIAIVVIFGLLTTFFILRWTAVLKISLIVLAITLIATVLLQSGRGGGLAAIGGLSDQSMMGAKTGSFLGNVTYLLGGAVFITVIFLSKASFSPDMPIRLPVSEVAAPAAPAPNAQDHEGHDHDGHDHGQAGAGMAAVESEVGMKAVESEAGADVKSESAPVEAAKPGSNAAGE